MKFIQETVEQAADKRDGAPPDYWQQYADDQGPFEFPLVSAWVTKGLSYVPGASRAKSLAWRAVISVIAGGALAVRFDSWFFLFLGAFFWVRSVVSIFRLVPSSRLHTAAHLMRQYVPSPVFVLFSRVRSVWPSSLST